MENWRSTECRPLSEMLHYGPLYGCMRTGIPAAGRKAGAGGFDEAGAACGGGPSTPKDPPSTSQPGPLSLCCLERGDEPGRGRTPEKRRSGCVEERGLDRYR